MPGPIWSKQVRQVAASIETFAFTNPVLIDGAGKILAGHGRMAAARQLGWTEVPCLRLDQISEDQKRAYVIADNRLAETTGWDREMLVIEFGALAPQAPSGRSQDVARSCSISSAAPVRR